MAVVIFELSSHVCVDDISIRFDGGNREKDSLSGARMPSSVLMEEQTLLINLRHKIEH
jgi:hypothetical protein